MRKFLLPILLLILSCDPQVKGEPNSLWNIFLIFMFALLLFGLAKLIGIWEYNREYKKSHNHNREVELEQFPIGDNGNRQNIRHSIPQSVKNQVWNRDDGKCVQCGSNENLEFDHIIPHSKGGANTYRNIQLLCEPCNRSKSAKIG